MNPDPKWQAVEPEPDRETVQAHRLAHPPRPDPGWRPAGPDGRTILAQLADPLGALARAEVPALLLRGAYPAADCARLVARFVARGLMPRPAADPAAPRRRVDIGTSLGNRGNDPAAFFAHAEETRKLFQTLFDGLPNPVDALYRNLAALAPGKTVAGAHEPDGRRYGPAIFRIHFGDHAYAPHFDSVRLREQRSNYAVSRFSHQFAGILCLQNDSPGGGSTQTVLYRRLWSPDVQPALAAGTFHTYAHEHGIGCCGVELNPGDLYFFNTRCIHEVPALLGQAARIVLAVFIGYSPDDPEVFVWS